MNNDPHNINAKLIVAQFLFKKEKYEEAIAECNSVLKIELYNTDALVLSGMSYGNLEMHKLAEKIFRTVLNIQPDHYDAGLYLLISLNEQGKWSDYYIEHYDKYAKQLLSIWKLEAMMNRELVINKTKLLEKIKKDYKEFK